jgi:hypothetical protein
MGIHLLEKRTLRVSNFRISGRTIFLTREVA